MGTQPPSDRADHSVVMGELAIGRRIGRGGMAEVHLGAMRGLGGFARLVVQKRILTGAAAAPDFERMFLDEARLAAELDHPGIVQILDVGRDAGGLFLLMEYLSGESLAFLFHKLREVGEVMPWPLVCRIGAQLCAALAAAHGAVDPDGRPRPIVHRDVTPSNVVVCWSGQVKLVDFGIARTLVGTQTIGKRLKGKMAYLAPEQTAGQPIDARADVFQVGIVLHELLTGERLFDAGDDVERVRAVCHRAVPAPSRAVPDLPREVDAVVLAALERDLSARTSSADAVRRGLEDALRAGGAAASDAEVGEWLRRRFAGRLAERRRIERETLALEPGAAPSDDEERDPTTVEATAAFVAPPGAAASPAGLASAAPATSAAPVASLAARVERLDRAPAEVAEREARGSRPAPPFGVPAAVQRLAGGERVSFGPPVSLERAALERPLRGVPRDALLGPRPWERRTLLEQPGVDAPPAGPPPAARPPRGATMVAIDRAAPRADAGVPTLLESPPDRPMVGRVPRARPADLTLPPGPPALDTPRPVAGRWRATLRHARVAASDTAPLRRRSIKRRWLALAAALIGVGLGLSAAAVLAPPPRDPPRRPAAPPAAPDGAVALRMPVAPAAAVRSLAGPALPFGPPAALGEPGVREPAVDAVASPRARRRKPRAVPSPAPSRADALGVCP